MPKGNANLKSVTEGDAKSNSQQSSSVEMKDIEQAANVDIDRQEDTCEVSKEAELPNNISHVSADANTSSNEEKDQSLPRKPKRLFTFTGIKKKDAKESHSGDKGRQPDNKKHASSCKVKNLQKQQTVIAERDQTEPKKEKIICQSYKRQFFDDVHAYEDPCKVVNNSATPLHMNDQNHLGNCKNAIEKPRKMEERPTSPSSVKAGLSKSTESIKAAVKGLKDGHASIMAETSIPRSIFASLVALLLSLIVFLAVYFLLHCPVVLSVAVAVVVYVLIFINLGFMDGKRMKCLILLLLPSVCSRGGRLALYLLLGYFVIKGPFCNMIGNFKTASNSIKCLNKERPDVVEEISMKFNAVQHCINDKQMSSTTVDISVTVTCLEQRCSSVKSQFRHKCGQRDQNISPTVCKFSRELSCINKTNQTRFSGNLKVCTEEFSKRYCNGEFHGIIEYLDEVNSDDDGCGFLEIFSKLFPLLILFVFFEGYKYENNYRTYNNFHNFFLTCHFQVIDQSRSSCDRDAVLPLRKVELREHVRPATVFNLTDIEKKELWSNVKTFVIVLLIVLFFIITDLYVFRLFDLDGKKQSQDNVLSTISEHLMTNNVISTHNGTTKGNTTRLKVNSTSPPKINIRSPANAADTCSINVDPPGSISKIILPIILSLLLLVIVFQAHVSRLQWYICSWLYPIREKERIFYLYNKILEDRIHLVESCRKRMKSHHRETKTLNSLEVTRILTKQLPWLSKIFRLFHINLRRCIICNDPEKPQFRACHGLDCSGIYCLTCSFDIDKNCLYCDTELKHSLSVPQTVGKDLSSKESLV